MSAAPTDGSLLRARAAVMAARGIERRSGRHVDPRELLEGAGLDEDVPSLEYVLDEDEAARDELARTQDDDENRRQ